MQKTEGNYASPATEAIFNRTRLEFSRYITQFGLKTEKVLFHWGALLLIVGFLLGRALILMKIMPFALPFFAAVYVMKREKSALAGLAVLAGAFSLSIQNGLLLICAFFLFLVVYRLSGMISLEPAKKLPFLVFFTMLLTKIGMFYVLTQQITLYDFTFVTIEAGLSFILTMIFLQSIPLISQRQRKQSLKTEEVICLIILLASVMTGTIGWSIYGLSVEHILSRYLVLVFAFVAGATMGSTVGVVTGLILSFANIGSLYEMSLLAFSGLLGGLLKEGKKIGTSIGLLVGTLLIGLYGQNNQLLSMNLYESLVSVTLFLFTPKLITKNISKLIPGTTEHTLEQQQYVRKIRDVTANRVEQFSNVFQALSKSFSQNGFYEDDRDEHKEMDYFLSNVTERTCQFCFKKDQCWAQQFDTTYHYMKEVMHEIDQDTLQYNTRLTRELDKHCIKSKKVIDVIEQELTNFRVNQKLKHQIQESRRIVAEQLLGVSQVMNNFAKEIKRERENLHVQEEQILDALRNFGMEINQIELYSLEPGNVDIEMWVPYCHGRGECEKIIAPMLTDILGESIVVKHEDCATYPQGYCHVSFGSTKAYVVDTGIAHAAKGGGFVSGDSYSTIELNAGKYAIAISDGMGNGERAHYESSETLQLLKQILQTGIEEKIAIKSVNSILSLRTNDEIFSTLDLAMIDLQDANVKFLKIGSTPSFIKRANQVIKVQASNLPMGIIEDFDVDVVSEQMKAGDLLIMMSDGVFEGPKHVENYEMWMKRKVSELETTDPQEIADLIMEEVIRTRSGIIEDDMTIVVAKVQHNTPKWSSIPAYGQRKKAL
ncbi:stage II sporulation protein E [Metabacillus iocasae]|uniref:Stage II sporulation protein E n=1 Tax=Priestia iocasae TaxID=2291674 RepID=A0ABS2QZJ4_9BACI|nr:stage II sporulation protein E [Metabacillus iocasae]MBM7704901.1 stage II sporulation protein E [Metabacillus iocasae]